ncbi:formate dehydrogenase-N subunit alpha [Desulfocurvus sp. DL9XJH121]
MTITRRGFLKVTGAGAVGLSLGQLGFDLSPVKAHAFEMKIEGAQEVISICPFCACCCNVLMHVKDGAIVNVEGDPDYPVSEGGLCAKGAALLSMHVNEHRLDRPLYRAPGSDHWEEKDWDWMLERIARRVKDTRDQNFKRVNDKGQVVNRLEAIFQLGSSQMDNEELAVSHQMLRGLGVVHMDHQARVCHSSTVSALAESFGRGAMTNHWQDIQYAKSILIMGSNAAEHHPISFKWVLKAKDKGATVMHVDPKFSRTSARCDFHVPLRSGTDIAFLGGMLKYILDNELYFKEYVVEYTNAAFVVGEDFSFNSGLFAGYDRKGKKYDKTKWAFEKDKNGVPVRDKTLKHPRCVMSLLKKHYSRYTLDRVSSTTGVAKKDLLRVYKAYTVTGKPDQAGTIMYALGWTQHTVGVQNIRLSAMVQLLLGNIGVAGGGISALRGEPNVQGSTDHCLLYHILPGYLPLPRAQWPSLTEYNKANTPVSHDPQSANWWQHKPKYMASLLKNWFGDKGTAENGFGYDWLPRGDHRGDYSYIFLFDRMYKGEIKGGFVLGTNPAQSVPNTNKARKALQNLDWMVVGELHHTETSDFWHGPGVNPSDVKTEVFLLPSCQRGEKAGSVTNSGRWLMWHYIAQQPYGQSISLGHMAVDIFNAVRTLYREEDGVFPEPILNMDWPRAFDPDDMAKRINGWFTRDVTIGDKAFKKGQLVPGFAKLADDGSTACANWLYSGSFTEAGENLAKRRDHSQTPMQKNVSLFPNFAWCWPMNRRMLYNRASVDANGKPWNKELPIIDWQDGKWVGDIPDGGWPPLASGKGRYPFIMHTEGHGQLFGPGREDGPFPEHYEPMETPLTSNPFSSQMNNPCAKVAYSDADVLARNGDKRYPIVLTTYSLTEHWCGGGETRNTPVLLEAEPQQYVEMSHELAKEKGIENGDVVIVESARGQVEAVAMVTVRMRPMKVQGRIIHEVGMPYCFGWTTPRCGDAVNRLTPSVGDPNTTIPEFKASLVNVRKAHKVTEL